MSNNTNNPNNKEEKVSPAALPPKEVKRRVESLENRVKGYNNLEKKLESLMSSNSDPDTASALRCAKMLIDPETYTEHRLPDKLSPKCALVTGKFVGDLPVCTLLDPDLLTPTAAIYSQALVLPNLTKNILIGSQVSFSDTSTSWQTSPSDGTPDDVSDYFISAPLYNGTYIAMPTKVTLSGSEAFAYGIGASYLNSGTEAFEVGLIGGWGAQLWGISAGTPVQCGVKYAIAGSATNSIVTWTGAELFAAGLTGSFDYLALQVLSPSGGVTIHSNVVSFLKPTGGMAFTATTTSAGFFSVSSCSALTTITQFTKQRVIAASALVTYMGSALNNGGQIAAARLPPEVVPLVIGNYASTASLMADVYDGALKEGSYSWFLPNTESEMEFTDATLIGSDVIQTKQCLYMIAKKDDATQNLRLRVFEVCEGLGKAMPFPVKCAAYNPHFWEMMHMLRMVPACTDNPDHSKLVNKICDCCEREARKQEKGGGSVSPFIDTGKKVADIVERLPGPVGDIAGVGKAILDLF